MADKVVVQINSLPITMRRDAAAAVLGVGLTFFKDNIQPNIPCVREGNVRLYRTVDLKNWADEHLDQSHLKKAA